MKKDTAKRARAEKDLEDQAPGQAPDQCRQIAQVLGRGVRQPLD